MKLQGIRMQINADFKTLKQVQDLFILLICENLRADFFDL